AIGSGTSIPVAPKSSVRSAGAGAGAGAPVDVPGAPQQALSPDVPGSGARSSANGVITILTAWAAATGALTWFTIRSAVKVRTCRTRCGGKTRQTPLFMLLYSVITPQSSPTPIADGRGRAVSAL